MALVLGTILLPLTFGLIEYGYLFYKLQQVNNAARHGARVAAMVDRTLDDGKAAAQTLLDANHANLKNPDLTRSREDANTVTVEIVVPYGSSNDPVNFPLIPKPSQLKASVTMAKEGA